MSHRSLGHFISVLCIMTGMFFFGHGVWIFTKAQLAQVLLERAFSQSIANGQPVKAWRWADTWPVAKITMPRISASAIVLRGGSGEAMAFGPTWLSETAMPGTPGSTVMAAHRDTHFAFLRNAAIGDLITVQRNDGLVFSYRVTSLAVVDWNASGIDRHAAGFNLILATCYPFDAITSGKQRYIVRATLERSELTENHQSSALPN
jgi:sortase A